MKHQKTIEQDVFKFIKKHSLLSEADKVLVGLSGGADSVFALHFLKKYSKKYNISIAALHVNHNLRGHESKRDEKFCRDLCTDLKIEFYCSNVNVKSFAKTNKKSIEEAARDLRYNEFEIVAKNSNCNLIVTSHNNDDNTETVLLNIVNGTGLSGLSGIPIRRDNIIRPFLCLTKLNIVSYLTSNEIKFVEDSSNMNLEFKRNFLRKKIIPELRENINHSIDKTILQSSEVFRNQVKIINYFVNTISEDISFIRKGELIISISKLEKYPKEFLGEIIKKLLSTNFEIDYNFNQFEKLSKLLRSQVGSKVGLGNNIFATREREKLIISEKRIKQSVHLIIEIGNSVKVDGLIFSLNYIKKLPKVFSKSRKVEFISGDNISEEIVLRNWKLGDKIQLLGMKGTKKISDVLTDLKIPTTKRKDQLVLVNKNDIVWIVGKSISEKYKITEKTKKIVKLCLS